ncbi:hypothetical protein NFC81_08710 [Salinispirillum sp. LH 10-3-1]|uniref:Transmembrane protein n=1 Tax=Salinispirillum sp. LH 10-3-1 TaxID=2952525 RepID=A0AB38YBS1_9GAMM
MSKFSTASNPVAQHGVAAAMGDVADGHSAVSWAAIFAGAVGAAALSLLLLILGTGLGFSVISPWSMDGISISTIGFAAILWLTFTQLAASGMGGYLAGRLRTKWAATHSNEVYFRDTAHGFMTWAVASLLMVVLTTSVIGSLISGTVRAGSEMASGASSAATMMSGETNTLEYHIDSLFRGDAPASTTATATGTTQPGTTQPGTTQQGSAVSDIPVAEVTRIFARALSTGELPQDDQRYIGRLIAERTELNQQQAEQRVSQNFDDVQTTLDEFEATAVEAADEARKASAYAALWMFITLSIGAFAASLMAVYGGRQRDTV